MEQKKGKVTNVTANGTWNSQYGLMYKFEITFDNGDAGEYNCKTQTQNKFVIGQDAEYTISSREYNGNTYYTIKPVLPSFGAGTGSYSKGKDPKTSRHILRMNVLQRAVDLAIADKITLKDIPKLAQHFADWVQKEDQVSNPPANAVPSTPPPASTEVSDLPF